MTRYPGAFGGAFGGQGMFAPQWGQAWGGYQPRSFSAWGASPMDYQAQSYGQPQGYPQMGMKQMGPSMLQPWMQQQKSYPGGYTPRPPPPMPGQPPGAPPPSQPPPGSPPGDFGPFPPGNPPGQPTQPNPAQFPGVPQHILSAITMDPSGRMLYGPDKSPVKFEGGKMVFDSTPFVPGQGQFGQYGAPGAGGFRLDASSGRNMIVGGANGPQLYNAEGLVQGSQAPQNFVNYLNRYGQGMFR